MEFAKHLLIFTLFFSFYGVSSAVNLPSACAVTVLFNPLFPTLVPGTLINVDGMQGVLVLASQIKGSVGLITCTGPSILLPQIRLVANVFEYDLEEGENPALQLALVVPIGSFPKKLVAPLPPSGTPVPSSLSFDGPTTIQVSAVTGGICATATTGRGVCVDALPNGPPLGATAITSLPIFDPVTGFLYGIGSGKTIGDLSSSNAGGVGVLIDENTLVFVQPPSI